MSSIRFAKQTEPSTPATDKAVMWYDNADDTFKYKDDAGNVNNFGISDHTLLSNIGTNSHTQIDSHIASTNNPHSVTKTQVGLGSVADALQLVAANNLSDLTNTATARTNIGLGNVANALQLVAANNLSDLTNAGTARTNLGVEIGVDVQAYSATLASFAAYNTNGILTQTAANTFTGRTITGTANQVTVTNGDGVSGNPTLSLPQDIATTSSIQFNRVSLGIAPTAYESFVCKTTLAGSATQIGMNSSPTNSTSSTSFFIGSYSQPRPVSGSYTIATCASTYVDNATSLSGGAAITNNYGLLVKDQTRGTNNYGVASEVSLGSNKWNIYAVGTANNLTNGSWFFGQVASEPTPGTNQAAIYAYDVSGTAELKAVDEAGNRVQLTPHPVEIMDAHSSLMQSVDLDPVQVPWGYNCDQLIKGVNTKADIAATIRCVEWLMAQSSKPITLIYETAITPEISWEDRQTNEQQKYESEIAAFRANLESFAQKPPRLNGGNALPTFNGKQPQLKTKPNWLGV